jgi:hypothetical protein
MFIIRFYLHVATEVLSNLMLQTIIFIFVILYSFYYKLFLLTNNLIKNLRILELFNKFFYIPFLFLFYIMI